MARKIIFLLCIFFAFYFLAHFTLRWRNQSKTFVSNNEKLISCEPNQIRDLKVTQSENGKENLIQFSRVDSAAPGTPLAAQYAQARWSIASPELGEADPSLLMRISSNVCEMYQPQSLEEKDFAMASSEVLHATKLEFQLNGEPQEIQFGTVTSDKMNMIRLNSKGKTRYARIPTKLLQMVSAPATTFQNTRLMNMGLGVVQAVTSFVGGKEQFTLERQGADWQVLKGGKVLGLGLPEAAQYINRLGTLRAISIEKLHMEVGECERGEGFFSLKVMGIGSKAETIVLKKVKDKILGCSSERSALFQIHKDILKYIYVPAGKLVSK